MRHRVIAIVCFWLSVVAAGCRSYGPADRFDTLSIRHWMSAGPVPRQSEPDVEQAEADAPPTSSP